MYSYYNINSCTVFNEKQEKENLGRIWLTIWPSVHKAFQNQVQDYAQVKVVFYGLFLKPIIII